MLEALIFDLDGTLADTEETHRQAFNAAFIEFALWWDWSPSLYVRLLEISGGKERLRHYIGTLRVQPAERARLLQTVPALHETKTRIYTELVDRGRRPLRAGVLPLLSAASAAGLKLAIASTTTSANVSALLQANLGPASGIVFDVIACGDQVKEKKPAPDIYRLVLASLRLAPEACIAFEDSLNGLRAAKAAGLVTVVTPSRWTVEQDFAAADLLLPTLEGLDLPRLDVLANEIFLRTNEWGGHLAGMVSEELEHPYPIPEEYPRGRYLLAFDPLDGSSNIDVNVPVGSIFSVLACPQDMTGDEERAFLQPGTRQVCAGYAIYGPSTMLVLTFGRGVHGFTLDREIGEFIYTHPGLRVPEETSEFAINTSNSRFWEPAVKRYVDECMAGRSGPRGKDFNMRWIASLVAEAHRILMRGGVFLYPRDEREHGRSGRLRLLYEANPIGMLIEQAGGRASTGYVPVLGVEPAGLHQRSGFVFGARHEVERIEQYHRDFNEKPYDAPLFGTRGLFRAAGGG